MSWASHKEQANKQHSSVGSASVPISWFVRWLTLNDGLWYGSVAHINPCLPKLPLSMTCIAVAGRKYNHDLLFHLCHAPVNIWYCSLCHGELLWHVSEDRAALALLRWSPMLLPPSTHADAGMPFLSEFWAKVLWNTHGKMGISGVLSARGNLFPRVNRTWWVHWKEM